MTQRPFFTIGIPTYNRARLVPEAIQSALQQTDPDFELLISDNASPDNTKEVVERFCDPRIQYFRQESNLGAGRNANFLVEKARGVYFILLQDDDLLHPEFLRRCRRHIGERIDVAIYAGAVLSGGSPKGIPGNDLQYLDRPMQPLQCLSDEATEISGVDAAIMQLFILPFIHPGIALKTEFLRATGNLFSGFGFASDNVTLARVGSRGVVLYDSQVVAFFRAHGQNFCSSIPRSNRLAARRAANELIIEQLAAAGQDWPTRCGHCLQYLPRRKRWKLLAEAWEGKYPPVLRQRLAESLAGKSFLKQALYHMGVLAIKADLRYLLLNRFRAVQPK